MARRRNRIVASDEEASQGDYNSENTDSNHKLRRINAHVAGDNIGDEDEEEEEEQELDGEIEEEDVAEEEEEEEPTPDGDEDDDNSDEVGPTTPQRFSIVIKRRARGRGVALPGTPRGRGLPRGRPRGRPRGGGRGRGSLPHGMLVVQKGVRSTPKPEDDDDEDATYGDVPPPVSRGPSLPVGTTYREVGGKYYIFEDDELKTEDDEVGNTKIDANGNLLGGRVFKAETFCSPWRANPDKRYMLSIEAARTSGFRDSLYYFRRNPTVVKLGLSQAEKDHLISLGRLSTNLKSRSVTIVTARSAFKIHGAKMVKDGRWVTDDYYEERARQECTEKGLTPGELVGELPDLNLYPVGDINQPLRTLEERRQAAAGNVGGGAAVNSAQLALGAGGIYRSGGPTTHFGGPGLGPFDEAHVIGGGLGVSSGIAAARRAALTREGVSEENWMWKTALRVHEANEAFASMRRSRLRPVGLGDPVEGGIEDPLRAARDEDDNSEEAEQRKRKWLAEGNPLGAYEPHTDMFHYRMDTQPTRAKFEHLMGGQLITSEKRVGSEAWGVMVVETVLDVPSDILHQ